MEKILSKEELDKLVQEAEEKTAARNRAIYLLQDAKARYDMPATEDEVAQCLKRFRGAMKE